MTLLTAAEVIILDLVRNPELSYQILMYIKDIESDHDQILIGISSVMTWNRTQRSNKPMSEANYKVRKCSPRFKRLRALETQVLNAQRDTLPTYVIASGILYGRGEQDFHALFRDAWLCNDLSPSKPGAINGLAGNGSGFSGSSSSSSSMTSFISVQDRKQGLPVIGTGRNFIPMQHVSDLAANILRLAVAAPRNTQYIVSVDKSATTQHNLVTAISKALGSGRTHTINKDDPRVLLYTQLKPPAPGINNALGSASSSGPATTTLVGAGESADGNVGSQSAPASLPDYSPTNPVTGVGSGDPELLLCDMRFDISKLTLPPVPEMPFADGLVATANEVGREFVSERKLRPLRVWVTGGPCTGKSRLAERIATEFRLPLIRIAEAIYEAAQGTDTLAQRIHKFYTSQGINLSLLQLDRSIDITKIVTSPGFTLVGDSNKGSTGKGGRGASLATTATNATSGKAQVVSGPKGAKVAPGKGKAAGGTIGGSTLSTVGTKSIAETYITARMPALLLGDIVRRKLLSPICRNRGYVLDGFPRTREEARAIWVQRREKPKDDDDADNGGQGIREGEDKNADEEEEPLDEAEIAALGMDNENGEEEDEDAAERKRVLTLLQQETGDDEETKDDGEDEDDDNDRGDGHGSNTSGKRIRQSGATAYRLRGGPIVKRAKGLDVNTCVDYVVSLSLKQQSARSRALALKESEVVERHNDEEGFNRRWERYLAITESATLPVIPSSSSSLPDGGAQTGGNQSPMSIIDVEVLDLPDHLLEDSTETWRTVEGYLTKGGRPFNYYPSEEQLKVMAAKKLSQQRAQAAKLQQERVDRARAEAELRARQETEDARRREEVLVQDAKLVEASSLSLRKYLIAHVVPALVDGLLDVCKTEPDDPIDHLSEYLFKTAIGAPPSGASGVVVSPHDNSITDPYTKK